MEINDYTVEIRKRAIEKYGSLYDKDKIDAEIEERKKQFLENFNDGGFRDDLDNFNNGDFRDDLEKLLDNHEMVIEIEASNYDDWSETYIVARPYYWYHQEELVKSNKELQRKVLPYDMIKDLIPKGVSIREFATLEIIDDSFLEIGPWQNYSKNDIRLDVGAFVVHYNVVNRKFEIFRTVYGYATGDITKSSNTIKGWVATIALMEYLKYLYDSGFAVRKPEKHDIIRLKISSGLIVKEYEKLIIEQIMKSLNSNFTMNHQNEQYIMMLLSRMGANVGDEIEVQFSDGVLYVTSVYVNKTNDSLYVTTTNDKDLIEFELHVDKLDNREIHKIVK